MGTVSGDGKEGESKFDPSILIKFPVLEYPDKEDKESFTSEITLSYVFRSLQ